MKYLMNEPVLGELEKKYLSEVIDSGWLSINGYHTKQFEKKFAQKTGIKYALAVQTGTAALHTALLSLNLKVGSKIVVPNYTCGGCITAPLLAGLKPLILDIEEDTFGLDVSQLKSLIVSGTIPEAVMLVHIYGFPARDTLEIVDICRDNNIRLLEDAAEAHTAKLNGRFVGTFGDITTYSIRSDKIIGIGEGGVVTTDNKDLRNRAIYFASRSAPYRNHDDQYWKWFEYTDVGMNYLLPHALGAIAHAQIEKIDEFVRSRRDVGYYYRELVRDVSDITVQKVVDGAEPVFWLNNLLINRPPGQIRKIGSALLSRSIEIRPGFYPLSMQEPFRKYAIGSQEIGLNVYNKSLTIPSSIKLNKMNQEEIIKILMSLME